MDKVGQKVSAWLCMCFALYVVCALGCKLLAVMALEIVEFT
jgi:hypothetical protein